MTEQENYTDGFDAGSDWQLDRCTEIVESVLKLHVMLHPEDTKLSNKLKVLISMMNCGE